MEGNDSTEEHGLPQKTCEAQKNVPPIPVNGPQVNGTYAPPEWDTVPEHIDLTLEIIRAGAIVKVLPLSKYCRRSKKGWVSFGRVPDNDWHVEHPSTSRHHCILQFDPQGQIFIYDLGSTHGTYLNKVRVKPGQYEKFRVGDQMKIADSERIYVLNGPAQMMPAQGMSKEEKRQQQSLMAYEKRKRDEEQRVREQMESAIGSGRQSTSEHVQMAILSGNFDWKVYASDNILTEKQQKVASALEKKERQIEILRKENERIQSKQSGSHAKQELTPGQLDTLQNNESKIEVLAEQVESLEDNLIESIRQSIEDKAGMKSQNAQLHVSDESSGSDDDAFYDRTDVQRRKKCREKKKGRGEAIDAKELVSHLDLLDQEKESLQKEMDKTKSSLQGDVSHPAKGTEDELDTYLQSLDDSETLERVKSIQKKLQKLEQERMQVTSLLAIADPEGYYSRNRRSQC